MHLIQGFFFCFVLREAVGKVEMTAVFLFFSPMGTLALTGYSSSVPRALRLLTVTDGMASNRYASRLLP